MIHVEWRNFDTKLVKFPVELSDLGDETDAVFISQIGSNLLIDTRVLPHESGKESCAARRVAPDLGRRVALVTGGRPTTASGLQDRSLRQRALV